MLRRSIRICVFCEARGLRKPSSIGPTFHSQWRQARPYVQSQKPKPSRMRLSPNVGRQPLRSSEGNLQRRKPKDPFSYLNQKKAPPELARLQQSRTRERTGLQSSDRSDKRSHTDSLRTRDGREPRESRPPGRSDMRARPSSQRRTSSGRAYDYKALKMQKILTEVPYGTRSRIKGSIADIESFEGFPLLPSIQRAIADALPNLVYRTPTPAQRVAIPALLGMEEKKRRKANPEEKKAMEQFLLAAETGSGKTLAYLLPIVDSIKRQETAEAEEEKRAKAAKEEEEAQKARNNLFEAKAPELSRKTDPARPRAIVLVPTAELVSQVGAVAKSLSHIVKFKAAPISAAHTAAVIRNRLFSPSGVDILISTPQLLASVAESNPNILSRVTHMIVDEADSLFDRSFSPSTTEIIDKSTPSLRQLILCSATIPRRLDKTLEKSFPDIKRLVTPHLHAIPRRVQLGVVDVSKDPQYHGNKNLACADTIWSIGSSAAEHDESEGKERVDTKRIIVFVNEREKTHEVAEYLVSKGIDAEALNRDTPSPRQAAILNTFTAAAKESDAAEQDDKVLGQSVNPIKRRLAKTKVIVTTDLGSRGIDTLAVRHVILYDVPHTSIDFIHRLGRTGRMGRRGRGIVLVGRGDRYDIVKEVKDAMYRGMALV